MAGAKAWGLYQRGERYMVGFREGGHGSLKTKEGPPRDDERKKKIKKIIEVYHEHKLLQNDPQPLSKKTTVHYANMQ